ncbi:MAG: DUF465 domain-containing protein [Gammaproteobacteria bacterium]|jgi:hypothetical protein|nr:DUF465 domain-containing protein [Gammaproteobacteria bacterium]
MTERVGPDQSAANEELSLAERLAQLQSQHRSLDQKIIDLQTMPWQNQLLVQRLKKEKLRLKDAIERLKDEMIPDLNA